MASNGAQPGNSDYAYLPPGWTVQVLVNNATQNLGYDVVAPHVAGVELKPMLVELMPPPPVSDVAEPEDAVEDDVKHDEKPKPRGRPRAKSAA